MLNLAHQNSHIPYPHAPNTIECSMHCNKGLAQVIMTKICSEIITLWCSIEICRCFEKVYDCVHILVVERDITFMLPSWTGCLIIKEPVVAPLNATERVDITNQLYTLYSLHNFEYEINQMNF